MKVWVIYGTTDYEGCYPPAAAYSSRELAEKAKAASPLPIMVEIEEMEVDAPPSPNSLPSPD